MSVHQFLYLLAIVVVAAAAGWVGFRHRTDSMVSDLEGQITLLKLKLQDLEEQLNSLQSELKEKRILER